jgi:hypothetical protein
MTAPPIISIVKFSAISSKKNIFFCFRILSKFLLEDFDLFDHAWDQG